MVCVGSLMKPKHNPLVWRWGLWVVLAVVILASGLYAGREVGTEGLVRENIARELLAGTTAGRQGLVSSVWWGPFSTLAILPVAFLLPEALCLPASLLVSALFGAATLVLIEQALRMWGAGRWRWLLALGVALNPSFLDHCWAGSSLPMVTCLLVLSLYSVTAWVQGRRLLDLIWFAFGSALLLGTGYEMSGWVAASVGVVAIEEWRRQVSGAEKRAVLMVALLPLTYTAVLWVLMCWLIMGDPLYAVRSLMVEGPGPGGTVMLSDRLWWGYAGLAALVVGLLVLALRRHDRGGVCLAVLALALPGAAGLMAWRERLWDAAPLLVALLPCAVLSMGHWMAGQERSDDVIRAGVPAYSGRRVFGVWWLALVPLVLADVVPFVFPSGATEARTVFAATPAYGGAMRTATPWLPELDRHVRRRARFAKVFVCGFESFAVLQGRTSPIFEHSLDFNFDKARRDYYGQVLYLLVHRPEQRNAMDSLHRKYPEIYVQGGEDLLYESDWGDWRLFELIQVASPR